MKRALWIVVIVSGLCWLALSATDGSQPGRHWPAFRGPLGTGVAPDADPPVEWGETKNIRWKAELPGPGHATPVVWADRIYLLAAIETDRKVAAPPETEESGLGPAPSARGVLTVSQQQPERPGPREGAGPPERPRGHRGPPRPEKPTRTHQFAVIALDRATGEQVWRTVVREEVPHEPGHPTASQASASPVTDGKHVWASFGSRGLYCLDRNGKIKWERDLGQMSTRNEFGEGASPVLHGDTLVVNWDHEGDSFIVALNKLTGEQRWKVARDEPTSWATPLILDDGGRALVVVSGTNRVRAYDLTTGKEAWSVEGLGANCIPTPVADSETLFVMSGYREAAGLAIRYAGAKGDLTGSEAVAWTTDRGLSYVPSPLLHDGKLYFLKRFSGILNCIDLKTGSAVYEEQRIEGLGNIYASPVAAAGRVYLIDRDGNGIVFRAGSEFAVLAQNKLDDAFDASPVIVGNDLYLRGHRHLYNVARK